MLKVLIADDEILVRVGISSSIPWEQYGFQILEGVRTGKDALQTIHRENPDILLTDIKMPEMDGIELIREIRKENIPIEIIVLSCYDDFELVKEAMRLGACDYIRKLSMQPNDLLEVMLHLKGKISKITKPHTSSPVSAVDEIAKRDFFERFIAGEKPDPIGVPLKISWEQTVPVCILPDSPLKATAKNSMKNLCEQVLKMKGLRCEGFFLGRDELGLAVEIAQEAFAASMDFLAEEIFKNINVSVSMGIGPCCYGMEQFIQGYEIAREIGQIRFYEGKGTVRHLKTSPVFQTGYQSDFSFDAALSQSLEARDEAMALLTVRNLFDGIKKGGSLSPNTVKQILLDKLELYSTVARHFGIDIAKLPGGNRRNIYKKLFEADYFEDLEQVMEQYTIDFICVLKNGLKERYSPLIQSCIDYVVKNLDKNISLSQVSFELMVSEPYLSSLFKKETGKTFTAYINEQKIHAAKSLLVKNMLVYEVAEKLGFENSNYFTKVFKKYTGVTPENYRKNLKK